MSWTYDTTIPTAADQVRLLIGDTDETDPQLQDEEIAFLLGDNSGNVNRAALACCEALQAKYARLSDSTINKVQDFASQRAIQYARLIDQLRAKVARGGVRPMMGGQSYSEKRRNRESTDLVRPAFAMAQFSEPGIRDLDRPDSLSNE